MQVEFLPDSSCTGCVVRESLVSLHQYTGWHIYVKMINGTNNFCPIAVVEVFSPFFTGRVQAAVMESPLFGLIVANVKDVKDSRSSDVLKQKKGSTYCRACYKSGALPRRS